MKKKENEFAILHNTEDNQFLIDTDFNHEKDEYGLRFKFWSEDFNGYAEIKLHWKSNDEENFIKTFERFRSLNECIKWKSHIENQNL